MTREEKREAIEKTNYDLEQAQRYLSNAAYMLEEKGMTKDAQQLMNIVYKLADFGYKYL